MGRRCTDPGTDPGEQPARSLRRIRKGGVGEAAGLLLACHRHRETGLVGCTVLGVPCHAWCLCAHQWGGFFEPCSLKKEIKQVFLVAPSPRLLRQRSSMSRFARLFYFALAALSLPGLAAAQDYPTRPVKIVVTFTPGGAADVTGRVFA